MAKEVNNHIIDYRTRSSMNYMFGFGSLAGLCLVIQLVTGVLLSMHYSGSVEYAFTSVEHIMSDVNNGWLLSYYHANGASMFFGVVFVHIGSGLYYGSYMERSGKLWCSGVVLLLVMMATGFIGYVLRYGQMSLWGATVITNMVSAIRGVGGEVVYWLWGGYSIGEATLASFYVFHYVLRFAIAGLALVHLVLLHEVGSSNMLGVESKVDSVEFYRYSYVKDLYMLVCMGLVLSMLVFFSRNMLGHRDNYISADSMKTREHIVREWYFLRFYAILSSIESKALGVVAMGMALLCLLVLRYVSVGEVSGGVFSRLKSKAYWSFIGTCLLLGYVGGQEVVSRYMGLGQVLSVYYFVYVLVVSQMVGMMEVIAVSGAVGSSESDKKWCEKS